MIKFYNFSGAADLTADELAKLTGFLQEAKIPEYLFDGVKFKWCPAFGLDVNGAFSILHSGVVYLTPSFKADIRRLAATAAHELDHRRIFLINPILYLVISLPFIREFIIEASAEKVEASVNDALGVDEDFRL